MVGAMIDLRLPPSLGGQGAVVRHLPPYLIATRLPPRSARFSARPGADRDLAGLEQRP